MHKILGPEGRVGVTKAGTIRAMVMVMVLVVGRPMAEPIAWMPMSSRGIWLILLKGIKQGHLVIMSIGLMRLSQKTKLKNYSLQSRV